MKIKVIYVLIAMLMTWIVGSVSAQDTSFKVSGGLYSAQSQADRDSYGDGWNVAVAKKILDSDMAPLSISLGYIKQDNAFSDRMQIPLQLKTTISEGATYITVGAGASYIESILNASKITTTKFCYSVAFGINVKQLFVETSFLGMDKMGGYTLSVGSRF